MDHQNELAQIAESLSYILAELRQQNVLYTELVEMRRKEHYHSTQFNDKLHVFRDLEVEEMKHRVALAFENLIDKRLHNKREYGIAATDHEHK